MSQTKIPLDESEIPTHWYNVIADMPKPPAPPLGPDGKPVPPQALGAIFPEALIMQEVSGERWIPIPDAVREAYRLWRPSPLFRARRLEAALGTPAKIFYKYEGVSPAGSHKPNTAVAQAYYNQQAGVKRLATETGAGQWGSALALAGRMFGIEVRVYMVKVSYEQKPFRRSMMQTWGAEVLASPTNMTEAGRKILAVDPNSPGSLGIAISEAVEEAASRKDTNYSLGSVLNHVLLHQTIIGLEAKKQMEKAGAYPDVVIASCGGGSNFGGIAFPFFADKAAGKKVRLVAVEPTSCPTLTKGVYAYDFGDVAGYTPLMKMYTLGHDFMPPGIHAGGLRYHGDSPLVSQLYHEKLIEAVAVPQLATFEAGVQFART
ncbi:MAG: TrpB-like pyridoxal phosphate-dependent enzyme, partial [Sulfurifustaceae bacterium]